MKVVPQDEDLKRRIENYSNIDIEDRVDVDEQSVGYTEVHQDNNVNQRNEEAIHFLNLNKSNSSNISPYYGFIFLRKFVKICICQFIFIIFVALLIASWFVSYQYSDYTTNSAQVLKLQMGNCLANLYSHDSQNIIANYRMLGSLISFLNTDGTFVRYKDYQQTNTNVDFYFQNSYSDITQCILDITLPKQLQSVTFECLNSTQCIIVQHSDSLTISQDINFICPNSSSMQINIKNIQTNILNISNEGGGAIYLNNIIANTGSIVSNLGPIVLQSINDFTVQFTTKISTFCFSAPNQDNILYQSCYMNSSTYDLKNSTCTGKINQCQSSSCNPTSIYTISTQSGSIYSNRIYQVGYPFNNTQILQSGIFSESVELDSNSINKIYEAGNTTFSGADLAMKFNVGGNYLLQQSSNSFWTYFSNSAYAQFRPWFLATLSAGVIKPQQRSVDIQLQPGFCPFSQYQTLAQQYKIQEKLLQYSPYYYGSTQIYLMLKQYQDVPNSYIQYNYSDGISELDSSDYYMRDRWFTLQTDQSQISITPIQYQGIFIAALFLSFLSALVFAFIGTYVAKSYLRVLQKSAFQIAAQYLQYTTTAFTTDIGEANRQLQLQKEEATKKILEESKIPTESMEVPQIFSLMSYYLYLQVQRIQLVFNPVKIFYKCLMIPTNPYQNDTYTEMSYADLKNKYEKFCYLNHMPIQQLKEGRDQVLRYKYDIIKDAEENISFLAKLKEKSFSEKRNLLELSELEKSQANFMDLYVQNNYTVTGIAADNIRLSQFKENYKLFCGRNDELKEQQIEEIIRNYRLLQTNQLEYKLTPIDKNNYSYALSQNDSYIEFIMNPQEIAEQTGISFWQAIYESIKYNFNKLKKFIWSNSEYKNENTQTLDILNVIYMDGWFYGEFIIILGELCFICVTIIPVIYLIVVINISYSDYSQINPKELLTSTDMLLRPFQFFTYFKYMKIYYIIIMIPIFYYVLVAIQNLINLFTSGLYPQDYEFVEGTRKHIRGKEFIWYLFLVIFYYNLFYIGNVVVWVILGAIINPNNFLVYASSAATIIATITDQYNTLVQIYESGKSQVESYIFNYFLQTVTSISGVLMKETEKIADQTAQILTSSGMKLSQQQAKQIGFDDNLQSLCSSMQNLTDQIDLQSFNLDNQKRQFEDIKNKFLSEISKKFQTKLIDYEVKPNFAELIADFIFFKEYYTNQEFLKRLLNLDEVRYKISLNQKDHIIETIIMTIFQIYEIIQKNDNKIIVQSRLQNQFKLLLTEAIKSFKHLIIPNQDELEISQEQQLFIDQIINLLIQALDITKINELSIDKQFEFYEEVFKSGLNIWKYLIQNEPEAVVLLNQFELILILIQVIKVKVLRPDDEEEQMFTLIQKLIELKKVNVPELEKLSNIFHMLFLPFQSNTKFNNGNNSRQMVTNFMEDFKLIQRTQVQVQQKEEFKSEQVQNTSNNDESEEEIFKQMLEFGLRVMKFESLDTDLGPLIKRFTNIDEQIDKKSLQLLIQSIQGILYLGLREWDQFYKSILPQKQFIQEIVIDCIYMGSEFIWSQTHLDQYSEINNQFSGKNSDSDYEYSNYNGNQILEDDSIEEENEMQSDSGSGEKSKLKQDKFIYRDQKLKNRYLINLIAKSFNMSESELIGLIQILRLNEQSFSELQDNQFITLLSQKQKKEGSKQKVLQIMKIMQCKNFLNINDYLKIYFQEHSPIYELFTRIYKNNLLKDLFQYQLAKDKIDPILKLDQKQQQKWKQFINNHQGNQFTFFTFLRNFNLRFDFDQNKELNQQIELLFNLLWEQIEDQQLVGIIQILLTLQGQINYQSQINLNFDIIKYLHIDENQFRNFLHLIQFQDQEQIFKSILYFIEKQQQKQNLEQFKSQSSIFQKAILQVIKVEQVLNELIYKTPINTFVPYQLMLLKPLFLREILNCQQPIQSTNWLRICISGLSDAERNKYEQYSLEVALVDDIQIKQNKAKLIMSEQNNQFKFLIDGFRILRNDNPEHQQFDCLADDDPIYFIIKKLQVENKSVPIFIYKFYNCIYQEKNHLTSNFCNQPVIFQKYWDGLLMNELPELHVYQNQKIFHAFLSIFQKNPDYKTLKSLCDINLLKSQKFIAYLMFQKNKQQVIDDFYGDIENQFKLPKQDLETIIQMLDGKLDFNKILQENKNEFVRELIKFYLALNNNHFKGGNAESNIKQEQQCRSIKLKFIKAHIDQKITDEQYNIFDFINWVNNPDPTSLFVKSQYDPILSNLLNLGSLNSQTKIAEAAVPIIINIITSIIKFDPNDIFFNESDVDLRRHQEWIDKNRKKSLFSILQYTQQLDQSLTKSLVLLSALTGINIQLIQIFLLHQKSKGKQVNEFFQSIHSDPKHFFYKINDNQGQSGEILKNMEIEKWHIITGSIDNVIKGVRQKKANDQSKHLELINQLFFTQQSNKIQTPKYTLLWMLRYMRKLRNLKYKKQKYCAQQLYLKHVHCIDMILKCFETFLFIFNYQQYEIFNKNLIGELILNNVYKLFNLGGSHPQCIGKCKILNIELFRTPIQINPLWLVNDGLYGQIQKQNQIMKLQFISDFVQGKIINAQMFQQQDFTMVQVQNVSLIQQIQSIVNKGSSLEAWSKLVRFINTSSSQDFRFSQLQGSLENWQIMPYHNQDSRDDNIEQLGNFVTDNDPKCFHDETYNEAYLNFYNQNKKTFEYIKRIYNFDHECLKLINIENKAKSLRNLTSKIHSAKEKKYQDGDVYFQKAYFDFCLLYTQYCYSEVTEFNDQYPQVIGTQEIKGSKMFLSYFFMEPEASVVEKEADQLVKFINIDDLLLSYKRISQIQAGSKFIEMVAGAVLFRKYKTPNEFIIPSLFQIDEYIDLKKSQGFIMQLLIRYYVENQNDIIYYYKKINPKYLFNHFMIDNTQKISQIIEENSQKIVNYLVKFFNQNCNQFNSSNLQFDQYVVLLNNLILTFLGGINNFMFLLENVSDINLQRNEIFFIKQLLQKIKLRQGYFKCEQKDLEKSLLQFMKDKNIKLTKIVNGIILENKNNLGLNQMNDTDFMQIATLAESQLEQNFKNVKIELANREYLKDIANLKSFKDLLQNETLQKMLQDAMGDPYPQIIISFLAWFNLSNFQTLSQDQLKILLDKVLLYPIKKLFNQDIEKLNEDQQTDFFKKIPTEMGNKEIIRFDFVQKLYESFKSLFKNNEELKNENYIQILKLIGYKYFKQGVGENYLTTQHYIPTILLEQDIIQKVFGLPGQKLRQYTFINLFVEQMNLETLHEKVFDQSGIPIIQCIIDHLIPVNEQKQDNQQFLFDLIDTLFKMEQFQKNDSVMEFLNYNDEYKQYFKIGINAKQIVESIIKIKHLLADMYIQFSMVDQIKFQDIVNQFISIIEQIPNQQQDQIEKKSNQIIKGSKLVQYINAIQSIIELKFENIDVLLFDQISSKTGELQNIINTFYSSLQEPFKLISTKQNAFQDTTVSQEAQYLGGIAMKIKDGQQLTFEDIFRILTKNPLKLKIQYDDFVTFLKRIGIELTEHKLHEILVAAVGTEFTDIKNFQMDINQYTKAMQLIIIHTMEQALHFLGISQELLVQSLMVVLTYLILFIAFILIGIQAFAIPGTFGSIINSLFPALGGLGLKTDSKNKREFLLESKKVQECVDRAIQIIQTLRF
ncbi:hypothetical protein pb186bvf_002046 [Paramecium bursaria]